MFTVFSFCLTKSKKFQNDKSFLSDATATSDLLVLCLF